MGRETVCALCRKRCSTFLNLEHLIRFRIRSPESGMPEGRYTPEFQKLQGFPLPDQRIRSEKRYGDGQFGSVSVPTRTLASSALGPGGKTQRRRNEHAIPNRSALECGGSACIAMRGNGFSLQLLNGCNDFAPIRVDMLRGGDAGRAAEMRQAGGNRGSGSSKSRQNLRRRDMVRYIAIL